MMEYLNTPTIILIFMLVGFISLSSWLFYKLRKCQGESDTMIKEANLEVKKAMDGQQEIVDKTEDIVEDTITFTLSLHDYLSEPSNDAKLALQVTWGGLPDDVKDALKSISHLVEE